MRRWRQKTQAVVDKCYHSDAYVFAVVVVGTFEVIHSEVCIDTYIPYLHMYVCYNLVKLKLRFSKLDG